MTGLERAALAAFRALDPRTRELLLDQARDEPRAVAELLVHAEEAFAAEERIRAAGGEAHLPALRADGDPAAAVWEGLSSRSGALARLFSSRAEEARKRAAAEEGPEGFPRSFPGRAAKRRGKHDTTSELVELLLDLSGWDGRGRLLEPSAGGAAFLLAAWRRARSGATATLAGIELHPFACRAGRSALALEAAQRGLGPEAVPRIERRDALAPGDDDSTWDLVLGNPPWVRGERLSRAARAALARRWPELARGNVDLAAWFVRRALDWLRPGGRLAFVLPQGLFEAASSEPLRRLLAGLAVESLVSLEWAGPSPFPGATVIPCLLVVRNEPAARDHRVRLGTALAGRAPLRERVEWTEWAQSEWLALSRGGRWLLGLEPGEAAFLRRLSRAPRAIEAGYGLAIRTGTRADALVGDARAAKGFAAPRPLLDGREVRPFAIEWSGRWLDYRPDAISDPKTPEFFAAPKVVLPRIALTLVAAVDEGQEPGPFWLRNTVMVLRAPGTPFERAPHALAALVGSLPLRAYAFRLLRAGVLAHSHRATLYARLLQDLPVPAALLEDPRVVARLERLGRRAARLAPKGGAPLLAVEAEIDAEVARAFGLPARELAALRARASRPPLSRVLGRPGVDRPTRRIGVKVWERGARYA